MTKTSQIEELPDRNSKPESGKLYITYIGTACFILENAGHRILIDPGDLFTDRLPKKLAGSLPEPDLILITHDDFDHCNRLEFIKNVENKLIIGTDSVKNDFPALNVITDHTYKNEWINVEKINIAHGLRPNEEHTGYIIKFTGKTIFFFGDGAKLHDDLELNPDILFVTIGGIEANVRNGIQFVKDLKPVYVIPMHWEILSRNAVRARRFKKTLYKEVTDIECIIPEFYERFTLD